MQNYNLKLKTVFVFSIIGTIYFLRLVFSGRLILPQFFNLGTFTVHYYGIIMALAVSAGWLLAKKRAIRYGIDAKIADDIIFWMIFGGFLGARIYHVLSSAGYYLGHPVDAFKVWQGGLSIYGAVLGGLAVLLFLSTRYTLHATRLLNWLTPPLILGQIIGRFGNLFNYEAFGYPTNLPWKMFVPLGFRPEGYQSVIFFHPWFLYEQIGLLAIFFIISRIARWNKASLFIYYLLLYNTLRFGLEFLRIDSTMVGHFRLNSITSLVLAGFALAMIILRIDKNGYK